MLGYSMSIWKGWDVSSGTYVCEVLIMHYSQAVPKTIEQIGQHVIYSATSHGHQPGVLSVFSWFEHPPRKWLKTMGRNTAQARLENRINKQVSAWTLKFVFKNQHPPICALNIKWFSKRLTAVHSSFNEVWKGIYGRRTALHISERNPLSIHFYRLCMAFLKTILL